MFYVDLEVPRYGFGGVGGAPITGMGRRKALPKGVETFFKGGSKYYRYLPTDDLCGWLQACTSSLEHIEIHDGLASWGHFDNKWHGIRFGFSKASDAVLMKMTWCGK